MVSATPFGALEMEVGVLIPHALLSRSKLLLSVWSSPYFDWPKEALWVFPRIGTPAHLL